MINIVTHNGTFHSDEVFAIALIKSVFGDDKYNICRTRDIEILEKSKSDPHVFVIDLGGEFNNDMLNFDHHQQHESVNDKSAVMLVLEYLISVDKLNVAEGDYLRKNIISFISNWDLGLEQSTANYFHKPLPKIISAFNRFNLSGVEEDLQFDKALEFVVQIIENERNAFLELQKAKQNFNSYNTVSNDVILFNDYSPQYLGMIKDLKNIKFYIHPMDNNWTVKAVDINKAPLPKVINRDNLVFAHKSRFITVFDDKKAAINFILSA